MAKRQRASARKVGKPKHADVASLRSEPGGTVQQRDLFAEEYPLLRWRSDYRSAEATRMLRRSGGRVTKRPPLPEHPWLNRWRSAVFPCDSSVEAAEQWLGYMLTQWLEEQLLCESSLPRHERGRRHDQDYADAIRDAYLIVRHCEDELGPADPPEEPSSREVTLDQARAELRRVRRWVVNMHQRLLKRSRGSVNPKKRGRPGADDETMEREARLAAKWKKAHKERRYKPDFARKNGYSLAEFNNLLKRVAARTKRANKS